MKGCCVDLKMYIFNRKFLLFRGEYKMFLFKNYKTSIVEDLLVIIDNNDNFLF